MNLVENNSTVSRFKGFAENYNKFRPVPPQDLLELIVNLSGEQKPKLVLDLGAGTGLSTRPWSKFAKNVIGIEPSIDMVKIAREYSNYDNVTYQHGYAENTELEDQSVDIISCSSSVHWMDPEKIVHEVNRIIRPGGVFVIYGYYYPIVSNSYRLTELYELWRKKLDEMEYEEYKQTAKKYSLREVIKTFTESNYFQYSRKLYLHSKLLWDEIDFMGFLNAHAGVNYLRSHNLNDAELGLIKMNNLAHEVFQRKKKEVVFTYSIFLMVK